jgi:hypothetical protein
MCFQELLIAIHNRCTYYCVYVVDDYSSRGALLLGTCFIGACKLAGEVVAMSLLDT